MRFYVFQEELRRYHLSSLSIFICLHRIVCRQESFSAHSITLLIFAKTKVLRRNAQKSLAPESRFKSEKAEFTEAFQSLSVQYLWKMKFALNRVLLDQTF